MAEATEMASASHPYATVAEATGMASASHPYATVAEATSINMDIAEGSEHRRECNLEPWTHYSTDDRERDDTGKGSFHFWEQEGAIREPKGRHKKGIRDI